MTSLEISKAVPYLRLMRPANILTAMADIIAGFALSGAVIEIVNAGNGWFFLPEWKNFLLLLLSTSGLYGGGVVLNDYFDAALDTIERPERPIPSGKATKKGALLLGNSLMLMGIAAAFFVSPLSFLLAAIITLLVLIYNAWGKHQNLFGPLNMGLCRGFNLLLGMSVMPDFVWQYWFIGVIPVLYIAAVTVVSRGETGGNNQPSVRLAAFMYGIVIVLIASLAFLPFFELWCALPFLLIFAVMIFKPLFKAGRTGQPADIQKAVKAGVLSLILMNASLAAGAAGWDVAILILLLLPVSIALAKVFAVT